MKKLIVLTLVAVMALTMMVGCGAEEPAAEEATQAPATEAPAEEAPAAEELSGTVNVNGSTSMADVIAALTEGFNEINPGVQINYTGSGSGAGIEGVLAGTCDLGLSSRALSEDEKGQGAVENIVAKDGVAVVINPENTVTDLTTEQIAAIYTGEITNWSEVGGPDAEIAVLGRDSASGTRSAFEEILGIEDACVYLNEYSSTGDVIGNVASNPNAIGYASLSAVDDSVVAVAVNGVTPTEATVADGSFAIQRPFVIVTVEGTELSAAAQAFLDYAMSAEVADIIAAAGAVSANG
ncbi:MAG TPA: phosphate ABC transporter substrate-binding protein [Candidatus Limivicinus faecipullorum]|nr:phosphate ABC transporter substrate-binding protein [Candidatus Limivicinus faecipullorum]